jgi:hypothetical protein
MAGRKLRCVALGTDLEGIRELAGDWLCQSIDDDFITYEQDDVKFEIFLYWPGCDRTLPRPMDFLMIFLRNSGEATALKECFESFRNVVFKVIVGEDEAAGLALAGELNAKWTQTAKNQERLLGSIIELDAELNALMKSTFDSIDTDSSGFIDINELTNVSRALGHELKEEELAVVFAELDENSDSKISYEEFVKWWKKGRRGKGRLMKRIVGMQAKTKHLIDSAHEEIKEIAGMEDVSDDQLVVSTVGVKIGAEAGDDSALGIWANAKAGNTSEKDEIASRGGLEEGQKQVFSRFAIKIADGVDPENARDALSNIVNKVTSFMAS